MENFFSNRIESLKGKDIGLFFELCRKIGIKTFEDVAFFIKNEVVKPDNVIEDLKCYYLVLNNCEKQ